MNIKQAMIDAGMAVSKGEHMLAADFKTLAQHAYFKGLSYSQFAYGMAHAVEETLAKVFGEIEQDVEHALGMETAQDKAAAAQKLLDDQAAADEQAEKDRVAAEQAAAQKVIDDAAAAQAESDRIAEEQRIADEAAAAQKVIDDAAAAEQGA